MTSTRSAMNARAEAEGTPLARTPSGYRINLRLAATAHESAEARTAREALDSQRVEWLNGAA